MTKTIKKHIQLLALTPKVDNSASLLKEQENCLNVMTSSDHEVLKQTRQYSDSLTATVKASQSSTKATKRLYLTGLAFLPHQKSLVSN